MQNLFNNKKKKISTVEEKEIRRKLHFDEIGVLAAVLVMILLLSLGSPYFLTANNLLNVGRQVSFYGLLAIGLSFVIGSGQIDISVGRLITLITFVMAWLMNKGINPWLAFGIGIGLGALCGLLNGGLSLFFNVHPMIITLGTQNLFWGLAVGLSNAKPIVVWQKSSFLELGPGKILGFPVPFFIFILIALLGQIVLKKSVFGRHVLAVGANRHAAIYAGINERKVRLATMVMSGVVAALAAGVILSFFQTFDPNVGSGMEMDAIGAAVIGGADLNGGYASVLGAFLGAFLIGILRNGLVLMGVGAYWNNFVTGAVILIAVAVSTALKSQRK
ncbi:MAG: ABC transporter permease [Anaerolineae bacterium]|nr:ABC transporter permease [Anaerolineae bacterium]